MFYSCFQHDSEKKMSQSMSDDTVIPSSGESITGSFLPITYFVKGNHKRAPKKTPKKMSHLLLRKAKYIPLGKVNSIKSTILGSTKKSNSHFMILSTRRNPNQILPKKTSLMFIRKDGMPLRQDPSIEVTAIKASSYVLPDLFGKGFFSKESPHGQYMVPKPRMKAPTSTDIFVLDRYQMFYRKNSDEDLVLGTRMVDEQVTILSKGVDGEKCDSSKDSCFDASR